MGKSHNLLEVWLAHLKSKAKTPSPGITVKSSEFQMRQPRLGVPAPTPTLSAANPEHPVLPPQLQFSSLGACLLEGEWRGELTAEPRNLSVGSDLESPRPAGPTQHLTPAREDSCPKDSGSGSLALPLCPRTYEAKRNLFPCAFIHLLGTVLWMGLQGLPGAQSEDL